MDGSTFTSQVSPPASNPINSGNDIAASKSAGRSAELSTKHQIGGSAQESGSDKKAEKESGSEKTPDIQELIDKLETLAENLHLVDNTRLSISFREDINIFVYHGIDIDTGEVVTEYPSKEVLDRMSRIQDITGLSVDLRS